MKILLLLVIILSIIIFIGLFYIVLINYKKHNLSETEAAETFSNLKVKEEM